MRHVNVLLHSAVMAGWYITVALLPTSAIAGPPFRTDDPEPVDYTHWEFYTFTSGTHISGDTSGIGPAFEFNYGLIPNGQLHIVAPTAFDSPAGGPTLFGYGDTRSVLSTGLSKRKKMAHALRLAYFHWSSCRPEIKIRV
jgi:hypothetical protein